MIFSDRFRMGFLAEDQFKMRTFLSEGTGAGVAFSPIDITGLIAWWDADDSSTITESSGAVSQWNDKSGTGNHLVQATGSLQPTLTANQLNGRPTIIGDGTERMTVTDFQGLTGVSEYTAYFVINRTFTATNRDFLEVQQSGTLVLRLRSVPTNSSIIWTTVTDVPDNASSSRTWGNVDQYYVRKATYNGSQQTWSVSGTTDTDALTGALVDGVQYDLALWDGIAAITNWAGGAAEILMYDNLLSAGDQTLVEDYLLAKWGI